MIGIGGVDKRGSTFPNAFKPDFGMTKAFRPTRLACLVGVVFLIAGIASAGDQPSQLPIGDESRRGRQSPVKLDGITHSHDGSLLTVSELVARLDDTRLLLVGESHTSEEFHRVQLTVLRALHEAGRKVMVGLEMMPTDQQAMLDLWVSGQLSEQAFLEKAQWYRHWGYPWEYYRPIFQLAKRAGMPLRGLNVPRDLVSQVRKEGFESLSDDDRKRLPPEIQPADDSYRRLFLSYFDDDSGMHGMEGEMLEGFLNAQSSWDASMAWSAVQVLQHASQKQDGSTILVVLVGSGHVAYGYGVQRQAEPWLDGKITTLIPVPVTSDGEPVETVSASYADFIWGVAEERWPRFPSLGIATRAQDDGSRSVLFVNDESPAVGLDIQPGDVIQTIDGQTVDDVTVMRRAMGDKQWGDSVSLSWRRGEQSFSGTVHLRRQLPEEPAEPEPAAPEPAAPEPAAPEPAAPEPAAPQPAAPQPGGGAS